MSERAPSAAVNRRAARAAGLRYVNDGEPGIVRRRAGRGFAYRDARGRAVQAAKTLERIRALAVPPAYTEVWICADARGHIQATGRDARGRKQYRYHPQWRQRRDEGKFDRVIAFGRALPALRRCVRRDLKLAGFPRDKVLAIVVAVMAETLLRIGNSEYARSNRSFGLTTLRNRHVEFLRDGRARFRFRGKSGQAQEVELDNAKLTRLVRRCQQLPGQALFQYRDDDGRLQPIDSGAVNDYLQRAMGNDFSAKDFRTWGGTLGAFRRLAELPLPEPARGGEPSERALASAQNAVIGEVAQALRNTPSVCRKAYIDPAVFVGWREGRLARYAEGARGELQWERAALRFLKQARRG
ncbi:DNA topoisomerase IB [Lysobacter sp. Hz 25]|uniref:DNA topoisomerase IB n=1 Tax=Lysobacter sp. Hz 25 TaxID=3383698 RepID=UPI0038D4C7AD